MASRTELFRNLLFMMRLSNDDDVVSSFNGESLDWDYVKTIYGNKANVTFSEKELRRESSFRPAPPRPAPYSMTAKSGPRIVKG
jgi:hypothetical protein